jgi:ABC-2 type transport system ATP-binding protein
MTLLPATAVAPGPAALDGPIIEAESVSRSFGDQLVLDDIDLVVPAGSILGVVGPSGCGKTTLVRVLTGMIAASNGRVSVFGSDPTTFGVEQRTRVGYMPQLPVLFANLTVWENLSFVASVYGVPMRGRRRWLHELLDLVDLDSDRKKMLSQCSGGMQRRLALAATLVHGPELLFLDEPTAGVDPILRERFWDHFRVLRDDGRAIVVPTQYVGEAVSCDIVAVMADGRLLALLPPERLADFAYGGRPILVELSGWLSRDLLQDLRRIDDVVSVRVIDGAMRVVVNERVHDPAAQLEQWLVAAGAAVGEISPFEPTMDDVFVEIIERHSETRACAAP